MLRLRAIGHCAVLFLLMSCPGGCVQGNNHRDEEKDPHLQQGRNFAGSQDFKQAEEEFEKALETNPHSAAAHFELACLYDTKLTNYAAAIYHYDQYLLWQTNSSRALEVKERIKGCKQELANAEFPLPDSRNLQREVDRLNAENLSLKKQLEAFKNQPAAIAAAPPTSVEPARYAAAQAPVAATRATTHLRLHVVKPHETMTSIAAEYGIRTSAVLAANPQTDPRRLRVGQSLNLP